MGLKWDCPLSIDREHTGSTIEKYCKKKFAELRWNNISRAWSSDLIMDWLQEANFLFHYLLSMWLKAYLMMTSITLYIPITNGLESR